MHHSYIPAGCIGIRRSETDIDLCLWDRIRRQGWSKLKLTDEYHDIAEEVSEESYDCTGVQHLLLQTPRLQSLACLFHARWIRLEIGMNSVDDELAILRVYILPDDIHRRAVDRSDVKLSKSRRSLLQTLDYSAEAWQGQRVPVENGEPVPFDGDVAGAGDDSTLLRLFNTIPSPNPDPESMLEPYSQDAMYDLLEGERNVIGLTTTLYPYQRRSAALMLQKETQPERALDPRLLHLKDVKGDSWYMDSITGVVLLEPRYYDGVSGGILAEEMGAGKTIICLSLILASRHLPAKPPDFYAAHEPPIRKKIASLMDMAASCATRHTVPWKSYFEACKQRQVEFPRCEGALRRNRAYYFIQPQRLRAGRSQKNRPYLPPIKIWLSSATLIIVPNNLVDQWKQEIQKHTKGLKTLFLTDKTCMIESAEEILDYDIILFSHSWFVEIASMAQRFEGCDFDTLTSIHFKRCIVDEGHKLGNSKMSYRSNLLLGLDALKVSSRWAVTGTPSHGLFGVDHFEPDSVANDVEGSHSTLINTNGLNATSTEMEKKDLERIGSLTALYLKARPWANTITDVGDTLADWRVYLMLPKHNPKSQGRWDCLRLTINSLIVRHRLAEVSNLLPPVDEKVVMLDGSYQDQSSLNLFSMMIVFNSVQSQRTDKDYFFHSKQKQALLQIVHNLKQASFFGGSFFTAADIYTAIGTAEKFLRDKDVPISIEDELLLEEAIRFGHLAVENKLRKLGNDYHEMALCVSNFPASAGQSWSLIGNATDGVICTSATMMLAIQKLIYNAAGDTLRLNTLLNGGLMKEGHLEREKLFLQNSSTEPQARAKKAGNVSLAGHTTSGDDKTKKPQFHGTHGVPQDKSLSPESLPEPFERTMITSTVSAKLKYLIDSIVKYRDEEKIIIFYENENVAWYLASMLDVLQIHYLIYAKGLTTERRAQYVNTFHRNPQFSVLLMDLSQAAFGLDMHEASRIYFINPVLNPQVEAQAIGRVRRISQKRPVSVETLVLRNSIDEVILERKQHMTQAEHRRVKSILDVRPIYNWIKNARVMPMQDIGCDDDAENGYRSQMADFETPQPVFGKGFGRTLHPNDGIILTRDREMSNTNGLLTSNSPSNGSSLKRKYDAGPGSDVVADQQSGIDLTSQRQEIKLARPLTKIRFLSD